MNKCYIEIHISIEYISEELTNSIYLFNYLEIYFDI